MAPVGRVEGLARIAEEMISSRTICGAAGGGALEPCRGRAIPGSIGAMTAAPHRPMGLRATS